MKRLEQEGYIKDYAAVLEAEKLNRFYWFSVR
jgi:DNA-binding Lrp family transcriptional regulator